MNTWDGRGCKISKYRYLHITLTILTRNQQVNEDVPDIRALQGQSCDVIIVVGPLLLGFKEYVQDAANVVRIVTLLEILHS